ncbi:MAG TPA: DUF4382 domain-containing protein [Marinagarivorans sp.]
MFLKKALAASILTAPFALTGCGGSDQSAQNLTTEKASLTVAITDGPVDAATAVVVELTGIAIKPAEGEPITVEFDEPKSIDLLQLQGSDAADLIADLALEAGDYEWVRIFVNASNDGVLDSYIEFEDGTMVELDMPFGADAGLKISRPFTLIEGEEATFTIDFDLRKSLFQRERHETATLRPHLRMVPNHRAGHVHGDIDAMLVTELCADPAADLGAVYVFTGANATPTDVNGSDTDPVASALVKLDDDGEYSYRVGFLEAGDYTLAYTCDAATDQPDEVNELNFVVLESETVAEREEHERPFPMDAPRRDWQQTVCDAIANEDDEEEAEPEAEETETDTEETETESETTAEKPAMAGIKAWCESGEREWMPRPDHSHEEDEAEQDEERPTTPGRPEHAEDEAPEDETSEEVEDERPDVPRPDRGEPETDEDTTDEDETDDSDSDEDASEEETDEDTDDSTTTQ